MADFIKSTWKKIFIAAVCLLGLVVGAVLQWEYDLYHRTIVLIQEDIPMGMFVFLMIVLPLVGFPLTAFILPLGVKYGLLKGILLLEVILPIHFIIAYVLAFYLRKGLENILVYRKQYWIPTIPQDRMLLYSVLFLACPIFPYSVKLYILPLAKLPFRYYFWLNWLIQGILCIPFLLLGKSAADLDVSFSLTNVFVFLGAVGLFGVMYFLLRRAQRRLEPSQKEKVV